MRWHVFILALGFASTASWSSASEQNPASSGLVTAVEGNVFKARAGSARPELVTLQDDIVVEDVLETQPRSRCKILFQDDTLITIGENSRVVLKHYQYHQSQEKRSMVVALERGTVRALVGRVFPGSDSSFQIRAPSSVVTGQGAYVAVWIEEDVRGDIGRHLSEAAPGAEIVFPTSKAVGVANIGRSGSLAFTSGGQTTRIEPGQ
ncbi:MAG: hypothetical protein C4293_19950 [Nitrospiraceae bacterium]